MSTESDVVCPVCSEAVPTTPEYPTPADAVVAHAETSPCGYKPGNATGRDFMDALAAALAAEHGEDPNVRPVILVGPRNSKRER